MDKILTQIDKILEYLFDKILMTSSQIESHSKTELIISFSRVTKLSFFVVISINS